MAETVLSVADLSTAFKTRGTWSTVTRNIGFEVGARETVALVGESGSGKSVTAMSIMRLHNPAQTRITGTIELDGQNLLALSEREMTAVRGRKIGMIFQEPMTSLNPVMTVGEQISEAILAHKPMSRASARAEAIRQLDRVRIPDAAGRYDAHPHQFSGGMRQRAMIAMALACGPKLLIADEPTTALDVTIQAQIIDLIKELQAEEGMSVLFITHDMGVVAEVADRTVVMRAGDMIEQGPTSEIFANPRQFYTQALLSAVPRLGSMIDEPSPRRFAIANANTGQVEPAAQGVDTVSHDSEPVLEVANLTTRFALRAGLMGKVQGRVHAVENVSFSLKRGETLAIVGESGCGKSTTGLSLLRLVSANSGMIKLNGEDITHLDAEQMRQRRKSIQMIFQDPFASLNPRMTVGNAVAEPMLLHKIANHEDVRDRVAALFERVGLSPSLVQRYPHQLSGGQRQRICIARALAVQPSVIVADESVSALDVSIKAQVINLLLDLQECLHLSYVFISHDMAVVERISHNVAVMYLGEIVEIGPRAQIFGNPQHPYTKKLLAAVPVADPSRRLLRRDLPTEDLQSPIRAPDYVPPVRDYRAVSTNHFVMT